MDLFVFSSLSETQGIVLVEAMAAELIPWDSLLEGIKIEWALLFQKTTAAADALRSGEPHKL